MINFLIVGRSYNSLTSYIVEHGHDYAFLADRRLGPKELANKKPARDKTVFCDFSSKQAMLKTVDILVKDKQIEVVLTQYEDYVIPTAVIAEHLGLPGLPVESAQVCSDKFLMRQKFAKVPEPISPDFCLVKSQQDLLDFAKNHSFPLILKPANLVKSLLVTKNHDLKELLANHKLMVSKIDDLYAIYAPTKSPKILVEEFMEGSVHSIEVFVDSQGQPHPVDQVVDYQTGYDVGLDDNFHYSRLLPSSLSETQIAEVKEVAKLGCQALGMKFSPAHVEIIMTKGGPKIVEIGARNGGYRARMHKLANGIDIVGNHLKVIRGQKLSTTSKFSDCMATIELFPQSSGEFLNVENESGLKKLPSLAYYSLKVKPGNVVGKSSSGYKMCAVIMLHNKDQKQFSKDLGFVNKHVKVSVKN